MNFIKLGKSGLKVTALTYGTALTIGVENKTEEFARRMVDTAWDCGIRSFDTANSYGLGESEKLLGLALSHYDRQQYVVASKCYWPMGDSPYCGGLSRKHILWAIDGSLKRLGVDYIDLYYAHRHDPEVPMEEVVITFNNLISQGKIRYWATSEWPVEILDKCLNTCKRLNLEAPIGEQSIYSYAIRKVETNGVKTFCNKNGLSLLGFSPLAQGILTGKYRKHIPKNSRISKKNVINYDKTFNIYQQTKEVVNFFIDTCSNFNIKCNHAAIRWCLHKEILPIIGASTPDQLKDNAESLSCDIPDEFWRTLEAGSNCQQMK